MEKIISMLKIKIWIAAEIRKNLEWSSHHHHQSWIFLVHKNRWRLLCQELVERESSYLRVKGRRYNQFVKIPSFTHKILIDLRGMKSIILEVINTYTSKVDISLNAISRQLSRDGFSWKQFTRQKFTKLFKNTMPRIQAKTARHSLSLSFFSQEKENSTWHVYSPISSSD